MNSRGTGKTRLLCEGLCLNWGLYFTVKVDDFLGARDIQDALYDQFQSEDGFFHWPCESSTAVDVAKQRKNNSDYLSRVFNTLLLARLLIFQLFLETASTSRLTEAHKKEWLLMQLNPELLDFANGVFGFCAFQQLPKILARDDQTYVQENIADVLRKIRKLLGKDAHLFCVLDEANRENQEFTEAFGDGKSLLTEIMRVWDTSLTEDWTLIFAGTDIPKSSFDNADGVARGYSWCSGTGAFDSEQQERYVSTLLPPAFASSPSGTLLVSRILYWLRGRYFARSIIYSKLTCTGIAGLPHS